MLPTSATTMQTTFGNADGFGNSFDNNSGAGGDGSGSMFNANSSMNHNNNFVHNLDNNAIFSTSTLSSSSLGNCKLENNNNMPWMNPEAASSSIPSILIVKWFLKCGNLHKAGYKTAFAS
nr:putative uncharacterized protein DDB_G0283051 [Bactrocera oleae]